MVSAMAENNRIIDNKGFFFDKMACKCFLARAIGKGHLKNNKPCQDFCQVKSLANGYIILTAADGHGGDKYIYSDLGAEFACEVFNNYIGDYLRDKDEDNFIDWIQTDDFKEIYIDLWKERVIQYYSEKKLGEDIEKKKIIENFGTTFLFVVVTDNYYVAGQLGDGAILFFDNETRWQLLKRHGIKVSSSTHSLCGTGSCEAMLVDILDKDMFQNIILSTDGIYDKLDNNDSFAVYACELKRQADSQNDNSEDMRGLEKPFQYINRGHLEVDVSEKTDDDCSIVLFVTNNIQDNNHTIDLNELGFKNLTFSKSYKELEIFDDKLDGDVKKIHITKIKPYKEVCFDGLNITVLKSDETFKLENDYCIKVYRIPQEIYSFEELFESGELLVKKFTNPLEREEDIDLYEKFPNEFWLKVYENFLAILDYANHNNIRFESTFFSTLHVDDSGFLYSFDDCFIHDSKQNMEDIEKFKRRFHILGKIVTGRLEYPIYRSKSMQNFIIKYLHIAKNSMPMCSVYYDTKKKRYLLWNRSLLAWNVEIAEGKYKVLLPNRTFPLDRNYVFTIPCKEDFIDVECGLLPQGDLVKYEIVLLK